jgi:hypothetical protein
VIAFLEGGYDLDALTSCTRATLSALSRSPILAEAPTSGGPGRDLVTRLIRRRAELGL